MGLLVERQWQDKWYDTAASGKRFQRSASVFRNWITPDGSAGPEGRGGFRAKAGRYHLYVSLACPWAHRTLLMRQLKGLTQLIPVSVVHPLMLENGWAFSQDFPGATGDPLFDKAFLYQLYLQADPGYSDRVTVPVLWDKQRQTIVSNERISCGCSIARWPATITPLTCAPPLMRLTAGYTRRSIMASTKPASLSVRRPTIRRRRRFSLLWRD